MGVVREVHSATPHISWEHNWKPSDLVLDLRREGKGGEGNIIWNLPAWDTTRCSYFRVCLIRRVSLLYMYMYTYMHIIIFPNPSIQWNPFTPGTNLSVLISSLV